MLYKESLTYARNEEDVGCIASLQMTINLTDDIPVQRSYASVLKPLYKEVKEYIQDFQVNISLFRHLCPKKTWDNLDLCQLHVLTDVPFLESKTSQIL